MKFKKTEIEILLFLINEIEQYFLKQEIFTIDGIVKGINKKISLKENRIPESTLKRFLDFEKTPNNIKNDVIFRVGKSYTNGTFISLESFKNRNPKAFDDYLKLNKDNLDAFFDTFQRFKIGEEIVENKSVDVFSFKLIEVKKFLKEQEDLSISNNLQRYRSEQKESKKRALVFSFIGVLLMTILVLFLNQYFSPFNAIYDLTTKSNLILHSDYPKLNEKHEATLKFYLPTGIEEKEINSKNEVILPDLPYGFSREKIKTELIDKFWKLSKDSIVLKNGYMVLNIEPNESLSKIEGEVLTHIGGLPIENAIIHVEDLETKTNALGMFSLTIPVEKRRIQYELSIYKEGYKSYKKIYIAGAKTQVRLLKNSP